VNDIQRFAALFTEMDIPFKRPSIDAHKRYDTETKVDQTIEIGEFSNLDGLALYFYEGRYVACETATWRCVRDGEEGGKWIRDSG